MKLRASSVASLSMLSSPVSVRTEPPAWKKKGQKLVSSAETPLEAPQEEVKGMTSGLASLSLRQTS